MIDGTFFSDRSLHITRATLMVFVCLFWRARV